MLAGGDVLAVRLGGHPGVGGPGTRDGPVVSVLASKSAERWVGTPGGPEMVGAEGERQAQLAWCRGG